MPVPPPTNLPFVNSNSNQNPNPDVSSNPSSAIPAAPPNTAPSPSFPSTDSGQGAETTPQVNANSAQAGQEAGDFLAGEQATKVMPQEYRENGGTRSWENPTPTASLPNIPTPPSGFETEMRGVPGRGRGIKNIILIIIFLILAGAAVFVYFYFLRKPTTPTMDVIEEAAPMENATDNMLPSELPTTEPSSPSDSSTTPSSTQDSDQDGLTDVEEDALGTNINDADSDKDGMIDGWEKDNNLNPLDPGDARQDPDADLLDNANEYYYGTSPINPDTDGDGYLDGEEVKNGYDPAVAGGRLETEETNTDVEADQSSPEARDNTRKHDAEALGVALELYYQDNGTFPETLEKLIPDYVINIPKDPLSPQYNYEYKLVSPISYELNLHIEGSNDLQDAADGVLDNVYKIRVME